MGRRQNRNRDSFRHEKSRKDLKRKEKRLNQKRLVIIACEDSKSSRLYLKKLVRQMQSENSLSKESCVFVTHQHTNPTGVLEDLKGYRCHTTGKTYRDFEHKWIVIDRDKERCGGGGHSLEDYNNAVIQARSMRPKVNVAWANPCFEIWYLLHFQYYCSGIDRDRLYRKLSEVMESTYGKDDDQMYELLSGKLNDALSNAKRLAERNQIEGRSPAEANPGTLVHELVEFLRDPQIDDS